MKASQYFLLIVVILFTSVVSAQQTGLQVQEAPRVWDSVLDPEEIYIAQVRETPYAEFMIGTEAQLEGQLLYSVALLRIGLKHRIRAHALMGRMGRADYYEVNKAYNARFLDGVISIQIQNPRDKEAIVQEVTQLDLGLESRVAEVYLARVIYEIFDSRETFSDTWQAFY